MGAAKAPSTAQRLVFLDWLRILAFGLLVLYHVGMYYVTWDWHLKSAHASSLLEPWMRLSEPWRMDLLFLVSGAATAFMLARDGASAALLRSRARRLLLPLLFGMLLVVPPQSWLEVGQKLGYAGRYGEFMRLYLTGYGGFCFGVGRCLVLPTWNHLWFLPYLFAYTVVVWVALRVVPSLLAWAAERLPRALAGPRWLLWPVAMLVLARAVLAARFPVTHTLVGDWHAHSQFFAMFLLGAVLARAPSLWPRFVQKRWTALLLALSAWAALVAGAAPGAEPLHMLLQPLFYSVQQWCAIVAALGFAAKHLNRDGPARRYLTDAVFPLYILHQTVIMVLAHVLLPLQLPPAGEGLLLVVAVFALCLALYEVLRRLPWIRPLFGLRRHAAARAVGTLPRGTMPGCQDKR